MNNVEFKKELRVITSSVWEGILFFIQSFFRISSAAFFWIFFYTFFLIFYLGIYRLIIVPVVIGFAWVYRQLIRFQLIKLKELNELKEQEELKKSKNSKGTKELKERGNNQFHQTILPFFDFYKFKLFRPDFSKLWCSQFNDEQLTPAIACLSVQNSSKNKKSKKNKNQDEASYYRPDEYFIEARSWADDIYTAAIISRNRYKLAFFSALILVILLTIAINGLIPAQHLIPLLVNHYQDGRISVQPIKQHYAPINQAQVESEIVRYVIARESYDASSYHEQYLLVTALSHPSVAKQYVQTQSFHDEHSPVHLLGNQGYRTVHVDNVIFLDSVAGNKHPRYRIHQKLFKNKKNRVDMQTHHNLAQIDFTITDHFNDSERTQTVPLTALISWEYKGTPTDPEEMWRNWDGFNVIRYTVKQRNVRQGR